MTFNWPWQYEFPPFFTLQRTLVTREKQLEAWADLVLDYCQFHRIYTLVVNDISNSELFCNSTLNRRLSPDGVRAVFDFLEQKKHIDWLDSSKGRCHVYWRRPEEWANLIFNWAVSNAQLDIPLTLHELTRGVDVTRESFYGLDKEILIKSLTVLVDEGRAQFLESNSEIEGVRFLH